MRQEVYSRHLKLNGKDHRETLREAGNYAMSLIDLRRFEEARSLLRKTTPMARRVLGESDGLTLRMRWLYARAFFLDGNVTLDDLREAVTALEDSTRIARRVLGSTHPVTKAVEFRLRQSREALSARETPSPQRGSA